MRRGVLLLALAGVAGAAAFIFTRPAGAAVSSQAGRLFDNALEVIGMESYFSVAGSALGNEQRANEARLLPIVRRAEADYSLPPRLLQAVLWRESRFLSAIIDGRQKSRTGAAGVAQFMPATAARFGVNPLDPNSAIPGAASYLRVLFDEFQDWRLAVAGYNAGEGAVRRYAGVPPFDETRKYVAEILPNAGLA